MNVMMRNFEGDGTSVYIRREEMIREPLGIACFHRFHMVLAARDPLSTLDFDNFGSDEDCKLEIG